jgi:toxin ParE1/3/4
MRRGDAILSAQARADLLEAVAWIAQDNPPAAQGLRAAVLRAARSLGEHPQLGRQRPELAPETVRFLVLRGLPYVIVYRADATPPRILRVLHGARDLPELLRDVGPD